eukprot:2897197-Prymnesium_polylepis.1
MRKSIWTRASSRKRIGSAGRPPGSRRRATWRRGCRGRRRRGRRGRRRSRGGPSRNCPSPRSPTTCPTRPHTARQFGASAARDVPEIRGRRKGVAGVARASRASQG